MKKKIFFTVLCILILSLLYYLYAALPIAAGYTAKYLCSHTFLAGRDPDTVFEEEVKPSNIGFKLVSYEIDYENKQVKASGFGFFRTMTAIYREGCGCTLAIDRDIEALRSEARNIRPCDKKHPAKIWPYGNMVDAESAPPEVDRQAINALLEDAFVEPGPDTERNTRAVLVVYRGRIIGEKYAEGLSHETPMLSWSMAKSVINMLAGILAGDGSLDIRAPAPVPLWKDEGDPRGFITTDQLLRMSSGLKFDETYAPFSDATDMLYASADMGAFAASNPLECEPGSRWEYSSGTTNIISGIIRDINGSSLESLVKFSRERFFYEIGAYSAVFEPDASGSFVGSSYMFATARDWARLGLLVLNGGMWNGRRILPEGWIEYSCTPTPGAPMGEYGAQLWLNSGRGDTPSSRFFPSLPGDTVFFSGFNKQIVAVIPSREIVAVRLGATHDSSWDHEVFLKRIIDSIE